MKSLEHLGEGEMFQLIDGSLLEDRAAAAARHLESCSVCSKTLTDLRHNSQLFSRALRETDFAVPDSIRREKGLPRRPMATKTVWYLAASIVFLIGVGASPLGALIASTFRSAITSVLTAAVDPVLDNATPPSSQATASISFLPQAHDVVLHISGTPVLHLRPASNELVRLSAPSGSPEFVVSGNVLRIGSSAEEPTSLSVWLPVEIDLLTIVSSGVVVAELGVAQLERMRALGRLDLQLGQ